MLIKSLVCPLALILILLPSLGLKASSLEYPLDLTCEINSSIVYFHFAENEKESWVMPHESHLEEKGTAALLYFEFNKKGTIGKQNKIIQDFSVHPGQIRFNIRRARFVKTTYHINRYSLGIAHMPKQRTPHFNGGGKCRLGFRTYDAKSI